MICPDKSTSLYKQIAERFPNYTENIWKPLHSEAFIKWYGTNIEPYINYANRIVSYKNFNKENKERSVFYTFRFKSKDDLDIALRHKDTKGITFEKGSYSLTKNKALRELAFKTIDDLNNIYPGLIEYVNRGKSANKNEFSGYNNNLDTIFLNIDYDALFNPQLKLDLIPNSSSKETLELIKRLESRIQNLKIEASKPGIDNIRKVELKQRLEKLEQNIENLREDDSISHIIDIAENQLSWVNNTLKQATINDSELMQLSHTIAVWKDSANFLLNEQEGLENTTKVSEINKITGKALALEKALLDAMRVNLVKTAQKTLSFETKLEDFKKTTEDTGIISAYLRDLSSSKNKAAQLIDIKLKNAATITNLEFKDLSETITENLEKLEKSPIFKQNGYDIFSQLNSKGEKTGNLVTRYSQSWYDALIEASNLRENSIKKAQGDKNRINNSWKRYVNFIRSNTFTIDSRILFQKDEEGLDLYNSKQKETYIKSLENEFGKERTEELITQAKERITNYNKDLDSFKEFINTRQLLEETDPSYIDDAKALSEIDNYTIQHSPYIYLDGLIDNIQHKGLSGARYQGYKNTVSKPLKNKNGVDTNFYDSKYKEIENDSTLKEFYDFYRDTYKNIVKNLPLFIQQQTNYIPEMRKSLVEDMYKNGVSGVVSNLSTKALESITDNLGDEISYEQRDPFTNKIIKSIPVFFFNNKLSAEEKSYDLGRVLLRTGYMALNYKHKSKVEDIVLIGKRIIEESLESEKDAGIHRKDKEGSLIYFKDGLANLKKQVEHTIDSTLYGKHKQEKEGVSKSKIYSSFKKAKRAKELEEEYEQLTKDLESGKLEAEQYQAKTKILDKERQEIDGKNLSYSKIGDSLITATRMKGLGWNIFSGFTNMSFGLMSNFVHANGRVDFDNNQALKALGIMLHSTKKGIGLNNPTAKKVHNLIEKLDLLGELQEKAFVNSTLNRKGQKAISKLMPYEINRRTEFFVQGQTMVAIMLNTKVNVTIDGKEKEINLWEAFDENGNWNTEKYGAKQGWDKETYSEQDSDFLKFRNRLNDAKKTIHGNFDPNSVVLIKKNILGRMLMVFRSWITEGIYSRFQDVRNSEILGREVKGRYRTYVELGLIESIKVLAKQSIWMNPDKVFIYADGSPMKAVDIENMRRNLSEIAFGLALTGLIFALKAGLDDDDEDASRMRIIINQIMRVESDIYFYINPATAQAVLQNPIPVSKTVTDALKAIGAISNLLFNDNKLLDFQDNPLSDKDEEREINKILNTIPGANLIPRTVKLGGKLMQ